MRWGIQVTSCLCRSSLSSRRKREWADGEWWFVIWGQARSSRRGGIIYDRRLNQLGSPHTLTRSDPSWGQESSWTYWYRGASKSSDSSCKHSIKEAIWVIR